MPLVIIPEKARLEGFERKLEISVEIIKIKKLLKVPYLEQVWMKDFQGVVHGHFPTTLGLNLVWAVLVWNVRSVYKHMIYSYLAHCNIHRHADVEGVYLMKSHPR